MKTLKKVIGVLFTAVSSFVFFTCEETDITLPEEYLDSDNLHAEYLNVTGQLKNMDNREVNPNNPSKMIHFNFEGEVQSDNQAAILKISHTEFYEIENGFGKVRIENGILYLRDENGNELRGSYAGDTTCFIEETHNWIFSMSQPISILKGTGRHESEKGRLTLKGKRFVSKKEDKIDNLDVSLFGTILTKKAD